MVLQFCHNNYQPYSQRVTANRTYKKPIKQQRKLSSRPASGKLTSENREFLRSLGYEVLI